MKPMKLTMQAFGPYPSAETIDFQLLGNRTMFVISGKTGAGKTTIFDGISFAIYGKASGEDRNGNDLRSQFASDDDLTEVSLTFSLRGKTYHIVRSPQQEKKKARGDGFTTVTAKAEFYAIDEDGEKQLLAANVRDVDEKIKEIIQLDANQFRQILMIPQGEFRKLLISDSKDKEAILQRLFHTEFYKTVQDKLKEESDLLKRDVEKSVEERTRRLLGIHPEENDGLRALLLEDPLKDQIILEELEKHIQLMKEKLADLNKAFDEKQKERDQLQKEIVQAQKLSEQFEKRRALQEERRKLESKQEEINRLKMEIKRAYQADKLVKQDEYCHRLNRELKAVEYELERLHSKQKDLTEQLDAATGNWKKEQQKESERNIAVKKVNNLENLKEDVFSMGQLEDEIKKLENQRQQLVKEISRTSEELNRKRTLLEKDVKRKADLDNVRLMSFEKEKAVTQMQAEEKLLNQVQRLMNESESMNAAAAKQNEQHHAASRELDDARSTLIFLEEKWNKAQAGILASQLAQGENCPVCGSEHHPNLAHLQEDLPDDSDIKAAKLKVMEKEKLLNEKSKSFYEAEAKFAAIMSQKQAAIDEVRKLQEGFEETALDAELNSIRNKLSGEKLLLDDFRQRLAGLDPLLKEMEESRNAAAALETQLERRKTEEASLSEAYYAKKGALDSRQSAIPEEIRSRDTYTAALNSAQKELERLKISYQKAQETYNQLVKEVSVNEAQVKDKEQTVSRVMKEMKEERKKFLQILDEQGFENYKEFQEAKRTEAEIDSMEKIVSRFGEEVRSVHDRLGELEQSLNDLEEPRLEALQQAFTEMDEELKELNDQCNSMKMRKIENESILSSVRTLNDQMKDLEERYSVAGHLAEMARGQNAHRLTFERYVLASFLEDILLVANDRLMKMTSGRYRLIRKKDRSKGNVQSGLELLVFDQYTGQDRHVKTLSGGESFKAALSLALGLADVVQQYAGGVSLETMFIDEGFGTLDPESLDHAIEALMDIQSSGRLVGLISHVPELKERIDARLEVISSQNGSTTQFQFLA
ncbi:SMC family ATPase [Bacillus salacetis]|uniref:Nuclease SbcCD subunit C n=1 Tax=Bacillus salacetis TaxID=2315464 RepID=A0A3A1QUJ8_9BACI|nr:SMC family ATPase [Bacillus salacetis]RIW28770.1 SMC family ATPase [Bacillus salacetis]